MYVCAYIYSTKNSLSRNHISFAPDPKKRDYRSELLRVSKEERWKGVQIEYDKKGRSKCCDRIVLKDYLETIK